MTTVLIDALRKRFNLSSTHSHKWLGMLGLLAAGSFALVAAALSQAAIAQAAPSSQSGKIDVRIQGITLISDFEDAARNTFDRGARIRAEFEVKDLRDPDSVSSDAADYQVEYTISFAVTSARLGTVFQGRDDPASISAITLVPGEGRAVEIIWNVPYDFPSGEYNFRIEVSNPDKPNTFEHYSQRKFRVNADSKYVLISENHIEFGSVRDEETPRSDLVIIARINREAGDLTWRVEDWPMDWLNLIEPQPDPDAPTRSVEVTNNGYIVVQVNETALFGSFSDEVIISSNAGEFSFDVSAHINRRARGSIDAFSIRPPREFHASDAVNIRYRIENGGRTDLLYRVTFIVVGPSNAVVYDSSVAGEDEVIEVADGETSGNRIFSWQIPPGAPDGNYRVGVELRNAYDFGSSPFDTIDATDQDAVIFKVLKGAKIRVSPTEWQFGSVSEESAQQQEATFSVTNVGRPPFEWQVKAVPDWIELVSPLEHQSEGGTITLRLKDNVEPGNRSAVMTIDSNGGEATVNLAVSIHSSTRRSPIPTATAMHTSTAAPEPTATHTAAPTSAPEPADTPEPTRTPVPPTATTEPTATGTPAPTKTPEATARPEATATPEPTATHTSEPPTHTATPAHTPIPTSVPSTATPAPPATHTPEPTATNTRTTAASQSVSPTPPPPTAVQPGVSDTPPGGACSQSPQPLSPLTSFANLALLLSPIALASGARWRASRKRSSR